MQNRDWLLVYLYLPSKGRINLIDPIRIMKGLFLFKMEFREKLYGFYDYKPYLYGPCSFEIYDDLLRLRLAGLVDEYSQPLSRWSYYRLTEKGEANAKQLVKEVPSDLLHRLKAIKMKVIELSFFDLLKAIYRQYPEYAKNSVINFGGIL